MGSMTYDVFIYCDLVMLLQSEALYVYTAVIHDTMDKSNDICNNMDNKYYAMLYYTIHIKSEC